MCEPYQKKMENRKWREEELADAENGLKPIASHATHNSCTAMCKYSMKMSSSFTKIKKKKKKRYAEKYYMAPLRITTTLTISTTFSIFFFEVVVYDDDGKKKENKKKNYWYNVTLWLLPNLEMACCDLIKARLATFMFVFILFYSMTSSVLCSRIFCCESEWHMNGVDWAWSFNVPFLFGFYYVQRHENDNKYLQKIGWLCSFIKWELT